MAESLTQSRFQVQKIGQDHWLVRDPTISEYLEAHAQEVVYSTLSQQFTCSCRPNIWWFADEGGACDHIRAVRKYRNAVARPTWHESFMDIARIVAKRSTCPKAAVGAVLVDVGYKVLGTGYNGAASGQPHCTPGSCSPHIHAELNAVLNSRTTFPLIPLTTTMYCTHLPCPSCAMVLVQVGVSRVVFGDILNPGPEMDSTINILGLGKVLVEDARC